MKKRISITIDQSVYNDIETLCKYFETGVSTFINVILTEHLGDKNIQDTIKTQKKIDRLKESKRA